MDHLRLFSPSESSHSQWKTASVKASIQARTGKEIELKTEYCYHIVLEDGRPLDMFGKQHLDKLSWLLATNPFSSDLGKSSTLTGIVKEVGPR